MNVKKEISLQEIKAQILRIIDEMGISVKQIILFGSRARGDYKKSSDWDLLVIVNKDLDRKEKMEISHLIRRRLAELYIPCDVLIKSEREVEERKNVIGSVIKSALKEGVSL
jgi:predicted nucleotidyltransferase